MLESFFGLKKLFYRVCEWRRRTKGGRGREKYTKEPPCIVELNPGLHPRTLGT